MEKELLENFVPSVVMTKQEEQRLAQKWVEMFNAQESFEPLDRLALGKHLAAVGKLVSDMLMDAALNQVIKLIHDKVPCEKTGEPIQVSKQFTYHGNQWLYQIKETYNQLGNQRLPNGDLDPDSQTYRSLEAQQVQQKEDAKLLTKQMASLKERILYYHPLLKPTDVDVALQLKEAK